MGIFSSFRSGRGRRPGANPLVRPKLARFEPLEKRQMLTTISVDMGDYPLIDDFTVELDGDDNIIVLAGTTEIESEAAAGLTAVTLNGTAAGETVTVWDLGEDFDGQLTINGGSGTDTLSLNDTTGNDSVVANAATAETTMTTHGGSGYSVAVNDVESQLLYARYGGADVAQLRGTANIDLGKSRPEDNLAWLQEGAQNPTDFYFRAKFFETVHLYGDGGEDELDMRNTSGDDTLVIDVEGDYVKLKIDGSETNFVRAKFFEEVNVAFIEGGSDLVDYEGSDGNDDAHLFGTTAEMWAGGYAATDIHYLLTGLSSNDELELHSGGGTTNRVDVDSPVYDVTYFGTWTHTQWFD